MIRTGKGHDPESSKWELDRHQEPALVPTAVPIPEAAVGRVW